MALSGLPWPAGGSQASGDSLGWQSFQARERRKSRRSERCSPARASRSRGEGARNPRGSEGGAEEEFPGPGGGGRLPGLGAELPGRVEGLPGDAG